MTNAKSRFLLLAFVTATASIGLTALVGCTIKADDAPAAQPMPEPAPTTNAATDSTDPAKPGSKPASSSSGGSSSGGSSSGGTKDAGGSDSGNHDGGAAVACLDDSAPAVQPACPTAGAGDECTQACDDYATNFKKGISADIRKCLTKDLCNAGTTSTCTDKALAKACADPTATTFCTPNVTGCKGANAQDTITQASCETVAKGLTAAGRSLLQQCFEQSAVCGDCLAQIK